MKKLKKILLPIAIPIFTIVYKIRKFFYYLFKSYLIKQTINKLKIQQVVIFNYSRWHHGYCYFSGYYKNKKVFIKIDTKLKLLENENIFYKNMEEEISKYLIDMYLFYKNKYIEVVVFDFLEDAQELNEKTLLNNLNYLDDIIFILKKIKNKQIIHRDIKLNNFMIIDNKIKIIDFTFSYSLSKSKDLGFKELDISYKENYYILKGLGFGLNPQDFSWNDFIAMKNIINNLLTYSELSSLQINKLNQYLVYFTELSNNATYTKTYNQLQSDKGKYII